jgi:hypothetical protein
VEGELIAEANPYCCNYGYVRVYADGRVLSAGTFGGIIVERRLSPEGVELVRSGTLDPAAVVDRAFPGPASAWEDRKGKPYVPARYGACFGPAAGVALDVEALLDLLPTAAQALLRGSAPAWNRGCLEVTPEEARSLEEILSEARASRGDPWGWKVGAWSLRDGNGDQDIRNIRISPLYPDGRRLFRPGG